MIFALCPIVSTVQHTTEISETTYGNLMYSLTDKQEIIISVEACREAHISLSEIPGIFAHLTYQIIIGHNSNSQTILREGINSQVALAQASTPGILDCQSSQNFWVVWGDDTISFGKGIVPEQNRVLHFTSSNMHSMNALSVMTPQDVQGIWKFYSFSG